MGEARRNGTYEERRAAAIAGSDERSAQRAAADAEWLKQREANRHAAAKRMDKIAKSEGARLVVNGGRLHGRGVGGMGISTLATILAIAGGVNIGLQLGDAQKGPRQK